MLAQAAAEPLDYGNVIGLGVDSKDHIWLIHRQGSVEPKKFYADANPRNRNAATSRLRAVL